jgi:protein-S-isoprenylcysteine O-methyltransferase Ste14
MYLGAMLVSGQLHALIAMAVIALAYLRKLRLEEKILSQNFGPAFDDYRRHSWALLPPLL